MFGRVRQSACLGFVAVMLISMTASAEDTVVVGPAAEGSPEAAIIGVFEAAIAGDFEAYLAQIHVDHRQSAEQRSQREKYEWKRFRKQHEWYLKSKKPVSFVIVRNREEGNEYKRYTLRDLTHPRRMGVPIRLKKGDAGWKVTVSSL
ncbi:MAG: hypothetical protein ACI9OJ_002690 [Myxococcota bacterium]|jgi:hypothetical protein